MATHAAALAERFLRPRRPQRFTHQLTDGLTTTVYVATWPRRTTRARIAALEPAEPLRAWTRRTGTIDALVGGFHVAPSSAPLGELWVDGVAHMCVPFDEPWDACRSCIAIENGELEIAPRAMLPAQPPGDLLQAGPLLVLNGKPLLGPDAGSRDPEGFAAGAHQFDTDISQGRHPRTAFGIARDRFIAVVCDGRSLRDAGMTLAELAGLMAELGAERALNLAGGGSASLVCGGRLHNRPRDNDGVTLLGGRPVASALVFSRRAAV